MEVIEEYKPKRRQQKRVRILSPKVNRKRDELTPESSSESSETEKKIKILEKAIRSAT